VVGSHRDGPVLSWVLQPLWAAAHNSIQFLSLFLFCTSGVAEKLQSAIMDKKLQVFSFADGKLRNQETSFLMRKLSWNVSDLL